MKVLCINDKYEAWSVVYDWNVKEGGIYTVVEDFNNSIDEYGQPRGGIYCLLEDPYKHCRGFVKSRFIPISDISETEMERNYNFKTEPV